MMERMHIVQAAAFPFPSRQGSQVYVGGMASALARRGHRVTLVCYGYGDGEVEPNIDLRCVPVPKNYRNFRAGPDWVKPLLDVRLASMLCRLAPEADLIHAHNYEAPIAAYVARRMTGIPVVYNNHNTLSEELHRYFENPALRGAAKVAGWALDHTVPRRADACVAISQRAKPILDGLGCQNVRTIPPGVDWSDLVGANRARGRASLELGERVWVVYAGNPDAYQDLDVLVDAVAMDERLGLLMVSAASLKEFEERAHRIPPSRKRFVRSNSWIETRDYLAAGDIAGLPRAVCSGFPIKLLNNLGLGLPTVCAEGSAQPVEGTLIVPNHDPQAFHAALRRLADDVELRTHLAKKGQDFVRSHCTWDARAGELERLYADLLCSPSHRSRRSLPRFRSQLRA